MAGDERILELVGLVYEAALDPSLWPVFLKRLSAEVDGHCAALFAIDPEDPLRSLAALSNSDPECIDGFIREFVAPGRADSGQSYDGPPGHQRQSASRAPWTLRFRIPYGPAPPAYLASTRSPDKPPFESADRRAVLALEPHIRRALEISRRIGQNCAFGEVLDCLPVGVVFADEHARPVWWNRYAEDIFRAKDGLTVSPGGLRAAIRPQAKALDGLIREAAMPGADQVPRRALSVSRLSLRRSYAVLVSPLKRSDIPAGNAAVVVLVTDPERKLPPGTDSRLACQFGLTPAEGRMAAALACGKTVEDAAAELSTGIATARTHVRSILIKTGATHQADLVRTLLTSPFLVVAE